MCHFSRGGWTGLNFGWLRVQPGEDGPMLHCNIGVNFAVQRTNPCCALCSGQSATVLVCRTYWTSARGKTGYYERDDVCST
jgi:hypothetical protein